MCVSTTCGYESAALNLVFVRGSFLAQPQPTSEESGRHIFDKPSHAGDGRRRRIAAAHGAFHRGGPTCIAPISSQEEVLDAAPTHADRMASARHAVVQALALDDGLAEAHFSLAMLRFYYDMDLEANPARNVSAPSTDRS